MRDLIDWIDLNRIIVLCLVFIIGIMAVAPLDRIADVKEVAVLVVGGLLTLLNKGRRA